MGHASPYEQVYLQLLKKANEEMTLSMIRPIIIDDNPQRSFALFADWQIHMNQTPA